MSLIVTLVIAAGASVLVGGVLYYTATHSNLNRRINQYDSSVHASVAATEKVVASITKDFQAGGDASVLNNVGTYSGLVPTVQELLNLKLLPVDNSGPGNAQSRQQDVWKRFEFTDPDGQLGRTHVERVSDWTYKDLKAKFPGLKGFAAEYRIISNSRDKERGQKVKSGVKQEVQVAAVPLCQFQLYYVPDLELHPSGAGMRFDGRVHCNGSIYMQPSTDVTFLNHVTVARRLLHTKHPADPVTRSGGGKVSYRADRESGVNTLNLPLGGPAGPNELREIIEAPDTSENPASLLAQQRLYNKADLVVVVSNDVVTARSGSYNGGSVSVPWLQSRGIVTRNSTGFYEQRQCVDIQVTDVDIAKFTASYADLTKILGRPVKTIWITDLGDDGRRKPRDKDDDDDRDRDDDDDKKKKDKDDDDDKQDKDKDDDDDRGAAGVVGGILSGATMPPGHVRLLNGQNLPAAGLTIATPNPLLVQGSYNLNSAPALLVADAITVLSGNWNDANGSRTLGSRIAVDTTINAALVTGVVPSSAGGYSGGAENALRLLEDWGGKTLTFNGSLAVLFYSKVADAPWGGPQVYKPPARVWRHDPLLTTAAKIPPSMPMARTVFRSDWTVVRAQSKL